MIIIDKLIFKGVGWVMKQVATAVDAEMSDPDVLKEQLLAAQMELELGQISDEEFAEIEADVLMRMRELKERQLGLTPQPSEGAVTGVTIDFHDDYEG